LLATFRAAVVGDRSIKRMAAVAMNRRVDTNCPAFSCPTFQQPKIACCHIVVAMLATPEDFLDDFHPSYTVRPYAHAFMGQAIEVM
jgi:hypothetical protein